MAKGQRDVCKELLFTIWLIGVETQKMPKCWIHQHRLVSVSQVELAQLGSSASMPDSVNKLIKLLIGDTSFFWTNQRVLSKATKGVRQGQVVDEPEFVRSLLWNDVDWTASKAGKGRLHKGANLGCYTDVTVG